MGSWEIAWIPLRALEVDVAGREPPEGFLRRLPKRKSRVDFWPLAGLSESSLAGPGGHPSLSRVAA